MSTDCTPHAGALLDVWQANDDGEYEKVQPKGGRVLTTQLYFPGVAQNANDSIYRKECEGTMTDETSATVQFVIA